MKGHAACLQTMIPVTHFQEGWPNKQSILLPSRFYQVQDGQGGSREIKIYLGKERGGDGKRDSQPSFFNRATISFHRAFICSI